MIPHHGKQHAGWPGHTADSSAITCVQVTFAEQLGAAKHQAQSEGEVSSKNEAKKLAFYLFWNIKPYFDRSFILPEDLEHFLPKKKAAKARSQQCLMIPKVFVVASCSFRACPRTWSTSCPRRRLPRYWSCSSEEVLVQECRCLVVSWQHSACIASRRGMIPSPLNSACLIFNAAPQPSIWGAPSSMDSSNHVMPRLTV